MIPTPTVPARISNDWGNACAVDSLYNSTSNLANETLSRTANVPLANPPRLVSRPASEDTPIPLWKTSGNQVLRELIS